MGANDPGGANFVIVLPKNVQDNRVILFVKMVLVMIPRRSFQIKLYIAYPKGITDPYFSVKKVRTSTTIGCSRVNYLDGITFKGIKGWGCQFLETPQIVKKILFHFDLGS
jgi:hypothetical protein